MGLIWTSNDSDFAPARIGYTWEALCDTLGRELGPEYQQLLAEPVTRLGEGKTDWYAPVGTTAVPASGLEPAQRAALFERLNGMRRQILALAQRIESPEWRGANRQLAQELRSAIRVPDESTHVWSAGGNPLLVAWGRALYGSEPIEEASIVGVGLARDAAAPEEAPETPVAPPAPPRPSLAKRFPWAAPVWLLCVGLIGASYYLLLTHCGIFVPPEDSPLARFLPRACHVGTSAMAADWARKADLERQIAEAELKVARREGDCAVPVQLPRANPPPTPPRDCLPREVRERLRRQGARAGRLEIALKWEGREDLDVHVLCPEDHLYHSHKLGCGGGQLDVDMNAGSNNSDHPVEHVTWATPPPGNYEVYVTLYSRKQQPPRTVPFEVYIIRNGQSEGPFRGSFPPDTRTGENARINVRDFTIEATPSVSPTLPEECPSP
jgi:hypothetical protein